MIRWLVFATIAIFSSAGMAIARPADCLLIVDGKAFIDGTCEFTQGKGYFQVQTAGKLVYFAQVSPSGQGAADGYWNEEPGASHAHTSLGILKRDGACWANDTARVCAWNPGEVRTFRHAAVGQSTITEQPKTVDLSLPLIDAESRCSGSWTTNLQYNTCLTTWQSAYDELKVAWADIPDAAKKHCLGSWPQSQQYYYVGLRACIRSRIEIEAVNTMKQERLRFQY